MSQSCEQWFLPRLSASPWNKSVFVPPAYRQFSFSLPCRLTSLLLRTPGWIHPLMDKKKGTNVYLFKVRCPFYWCSSYYIRYYVPWNDLFCAYAISLLFCVYEIHFSIWALLKAIDSQDVLVVCGHTQKTRLFRKYQRIHYIPPILASISAGTLAFVTLRRESDLCSRFLHHKQPRARLLLLWVIEINKPLSQSRQSIYLFFFLRIYWQYIDEHPEKKFYGHISVPGEYEQSHRVASSALASPRCFSLCMFSVMCWYVFLASSITFG